MIGKHVIRVIKFILIVKNSALPLVLVDIILAQGGLA